MTEWSEEENGIAKLRKQFKEQGKLLKELQEKNLKLEAERGSVAVTEALTSRGLDPRIAKFYPQDTAADAASVDKWVEENRDLFGARPEPVVQAGEVNAGSLTDSEMRGYQTQKDIAAYDTRLVMDLKTRLDSIKPDPLNAEGPTQQVMDVLREYEGVINQ